MGELRKRGDIWWIRYYRGGRRYEESARTEKWEVARDLLRDKEGDISKGLPVSPKIGRLRFEEAAADVVTDYRINGKRSLEVVERRISKHLTPWFGGRRMTTITTPDVRAYVAKRLSDTTVVRAAYTIKRKDGTEKRIPEHTRTIARVSNGEINRELTILKRTFRLALQAGKLLHAPHIPLLRENNTRTGFFEPEQYASVRRHLPAALQPVVEFAYITGWRIDSEVLPLEWRNVDLKAGEIRLDAGTTKNREGRVFPITDDLRVLLEAQQAQHVQAQKAEAGIVKWVFFRLVAAGRKGPKKARPIRSLGKAWKTACLDAGCPGRIPHDLRRTAVRNMVRRAVPERVAMTLSGHKTRSVFERYNIVSAGDLKTAAEQLRGLTGTIQGQSGDVTVAEKSESAKLLRKVGGAARN